MEGFIAKADQHSIAINDDARWPAEPRESSGLPMLPRRHSQGGPTTDGSDVIFWFGGQEVRRTNSQFINLTDDHIGHGR